MNAIGTPERPLRVAIVGAGPSGFFAAAALLKSDAAVAVDIIERLPAPFGLVRYGVAPDHAKIKRVEAGYERTLAHESVRYFGNVDVGRAVGVRELVDHYDAVILTVGASSDRRLGIPGEDLVGSWSSTEFVGWYNGHPDFQEREFELDRVQRAVVVGVGNVAVDVARVLVRDRAELATTDITSGSLDALRGSPIHEVVLLGRRGVAQAKFSPSEIKELAGLDGVVCRADEVSRAVDEASSEWLERQSEKSFRRNVAFVSELGDVPSADGRTVTLQFCTSPVEILGDERGRVRGVRVRRNRLEPDGEWPPRPMPTDEMWEIPCEAVFRSVGYRGVAIPGVPFDDRRGVIPNRAGRVVDGAGDFGGALYTAGWIKRGPSGLIGTNKADAVETVTAVLEDHVGRSVDSDSSWVERTEMFWSERVASLFRGSDWRLLDAAEKAAGEAIGKPREKVTAVAAMLRAVGR